MSAVIKNPVSLASRAERPAGNVYRYADRTGGNVMKASKEDVSRRLAVLIDEIRTRYTLGYYPSAEQVKGKFCRIKLDLKPQVYKREGALVVRTKEG